MLSFRRRKRRCDGVKAGDTLDTLPVHRRATLKDKQALALHTQRDSGRFREGKPCVDWEKMQTPPRKASDLETQPLISLLRDH